MNDIRQIAPGVVRIPTGISNAYLVGSSKQWVRIDTGTDHAKTIIEAAEERFGDTSPEVIYLTHGHFDHSGSAATLSDYWNVPVLAHPLELPFLDGRASYPPPDPTVGGFMSQMIRIVPIKKVNLGGRLRAMPARRLPGLNGWDVVHTPGHTPGHVSFFRRADRALIAGDAFTTINQDRFIGMITKRSEVCRPPAYYTIDWDDAQESVRKLASLRPNLLAAGHGEPMSGRPALDGLRELAEDIQAPDHGRYVSQPVVSDEDGVAYVPPPAPDPVKRAATGFALGGGALGMAIYLRRKRQRSNWERYAA